MRQAFPEYFATCHSVCCIDVGRPGKMFVFETGPMTNPQHIINFPSKQ